MATCSDIITHALKLGKVIASGTTPDADESADGMRCLQSMYDGWRTKGMFGELEDVYLEENDVAEEGKRYFVPTGLTLTAATSVYDDEGATRQPRDLALYEALTEAGTQTVCLYDRTAWVDLTGLELADTAPLSGRGEMGLAAALACSGAFLAMFDDAAVSPRVERLSRDFIANVMWKGGSTQDKPAGEYY
jgi:hypothetical protein